MKSSAVTKECKAPRRQVMLTTQVLQLVATTPSHGKNVDNEAW